MQRQKYLIGKSKIHGLGVIAKTNIGEKEIIDVGIDFWVGLFPYVTPDFGSYINHCRNANTKLIYLNNKYYVFSLKKINRGEEITINYDYCPWFIAGSKHWYKDC
jgi:SET domain-containing protein